MGDVVFKGFHCLDSQCTEFIFVRKDEVVQDFDIVCPSCGTHIRSGEETKFYDYELTDLTTDSVIESGSFAVLHDDYIAEAQEYKYCIVCNTMKPLHFFDRHSRRASGRQGECRLCKAVYNSIKNQTRLTDQHREAAQKRRLYIDLSGSSKINSKLIYERFGFQCFKCGKDLGEADQAERNLDHTLPAVYLWPLTTENATLLCREHNAEKSGKWPSEYYSEQELRRLSILTGISYDTLSGSPHYNPEALNRLQDPVHIDNLLSKYAAYMLEIFRLRNRILRSEGFDFFEFSSSISPAWVRMANEDYDRIVGRVWPPNTERDTGAK